jgi:NADPH2:quinone reductase
LLSVVLDRFGGPEVLQTRPVYPAPPGPAEVRVRVAFATVNPTDALLRSGAQTSALESATGPWTPGMELCGIIDAVGTDLHELDLQPGSAVVGLVNPRRAQGGAQSGWTCVPAMWLAPCPTGLPGPEAATLPMNGVTALMVMEALQSQNVKTVLVAGAAGALGGYVVQLASSANMVVVGQGRPGDVRQMEALGATHILTSTHDVVEGARKLVPQGVDALVDAALLGSPAREAVRPDGLVVLVRPTEVPDDGRRSHTVSVTQRIGDTAALRQVVAWTEQGRLTPRVHSVIPVAEVQRAYRLVESGGVRGRVVLDLRARSEDRHGERAAGTGRDLKAASTLQAAWPATGAVDHQRGAEMPTTRHG